MIGFLGMQAVLVSFQDPSRGRSLSALLFGVGEEIWAVKKDSWEIPHELRKMIVVKGGKLFSHRPWGTNSHKPSFIFGSAVIGSWLAFRVVLD